MASSRTVKEIEQDKAQKLMNTIAWYCAYYRANPNRYVSEVLGIHLKVFQKIILHAMVVYNFTMYLAARGQGFN